MLEQCKKNWLYKEAAYILVKHNRKDEVLSTLIDEMDVFEEAVKYVVWTHSQDHNSWKYLISKAKGDVFKVLAILKDIDYYNEYTREEMTLDWICLEEEILD